MIPTGSWLSNVAMWVWEGSLRAGVLVAAIVLVQVLLGRRLSPRWRYGLWSVLLIRLLIPWAPETPFSLYGVIPAGSLPGREQVEDAGGDSVPGDLLIGGSVSGSTESSAVAGEAGAVSPPSGEGVAKARAVDSNSLQAGERGAAARADSSSTGSAFHPLAWLPIVWLVGAVVVGGLALRQVFLLGRAVSHCRLLTQQRILDLLEDCKEEMGIRAYLAVVESRHVESPALFGFIRPRLLLPAGMIDELDTEELRHVFLHELSHLHRQDIAVGWLMAVVQIVHWFNPLVWYAMYRMRSDREMACDALALSCRRPVEPAAYGRTMVRLAELFSQPGRLANLAGVLEDSSQLRRRIQMIAGFEKSHRSASIVAVCAIVLLAGVGLTDPPATADYVMKSRPFVTDPDLVGQWTSVDFVRTPEEFRPGEQQWKDGLYLKGLSFYGDGKTSGPWVWTKGRIQHPGDKSEGAYSIRQLDGATYLFMEWISGDVTIREQKPRYYVLKKEAATEAPAALNIPTDTHPPEFWSMKARPFVPDPDLVGRWTAVDFVRSPDRFQPGKLQWTGDLYLKQMTFGEGGTTAGPWRWTKDWLQHPGDKSEGRYWIRKLDGATYLFMEWISGDVTIRGQQPWFYVFKKETEPAERVAVDAPKPVAPGAADGASRAMKSRSFVPDPDVEGSWTSVDFVRTVEQFQPGAKQWKGDLFLKGLSFYEDGRTSGPWVWTKGWLQHPGDKSEGRYWVRDINGAKYLYMEWISGDVTIRGQQPWLYVMEKNTSGAAPSR